MAGNTRIRQGIHNLSDAEVGVLRNAYTKMMGISDNRGYQYYGGLHGIPSFYCKHSQSGAPAYLFLPWHRAYLYHFELACRDQDSKFILPWWDWTLRPPRQDGIPSIYATPTFSGNTRNPLYSFHINLPNLPLSRDTRRQPQAATELPAESDIEDALGRSDWTDFTLNLEGGMHNWVHGWTGGHMGVVAVAGFDPIFWSHHCMIDRIWWMWQVKNGVGNIPSDLQDEVLAPFNLRVRDVLNVNELGYDYAAAQSEVPI